MSGNDLLDDVVNMMDWTPGGSNQWKEQIRHMDRSDRDRVVWAFLFMIVEGLPNDGDPFLRMHISSLRDCAYRAALGGRVIVDSDYTGKPGFRYAESLCIVSSMLRYGAKGEDGKAEFLARLGDLMECFAKEGTSGIYGVLIKAARWVYLHVPEEHDLQ